MNSRILKAFWHKGRRTFTCWTAEELSRRTGLTSDQVGLILQGMAKRKIASSNNAKGGHRVRRYEDGVPSTWELTPAGKAQAEQIIRAEAIARSV